MRNVIDMEKHMEVCQEYEEKIDDLYSRLSNLKEDYDDFKENSKLKKVGKVEVDKKKLDKVLGVVTVYCAHLFFDTNDNHCCTRNCNKCFFSSKEKLKEWIRKEN